MTQAALHIWSIVVLWMVIVNAFFLIYNAMQIHHNSKNSQIQERDKMITNLKADLDISRKTIIRMLNNYSTGRTHANPRTDFLEEKFNHE